MYQRNLDIQLLLARIIFVAGVILCIYFSNNGLTEYAYLLGVLLLFSTVISFTQLRISSSNIHITNYYFFAFIPIKHQFYKSDIITIHPFEVELDSEPGGAADTGTWFDLVLIFLPRPKAKFKRFIIEYKDEKGGAKRLRMGLSDEEVDLMLRGNL
jgi:hypothetical protein